MEAGPRCAPDCSQSQLQALSVIWSTESLHWGPVWTNLILFSCATFETHGIMSLSMSKFLNIWTLFWLLFKAHSEPRRTLAPSLLHIIFKEELQLHTYKPTVALMNHSALATTCFDHYYGSCYLYLCIYLSIYRSTCIFHLCLPIYIYMSIYLAIYI